MRRPKVIEMMQSIPVLLTLLCVTYVASDFNLTVMHTANRLSATFELDSKKEPCTNTTPTKGKCFGGMARLHYKVEEIRKQKTNSLLLDAGDFTDATSIWYMLFKGALVSQLTNIIRYDAMILGEMELRLGEKFIKGLSRNLTTNIVATNADSSQYMFNFDYEIKPYIIFKFGHNEMVGVIGYTSPSSASPNERKKMKLTDELPAIRAAVKELTDKGVNKIIALAHSGPEVDGQLVGQMEGVDVIVGGHKSPLFYTGTPPSTEKAERPYPWVRKDRDGNNVLIVHASSRAKYLGKLDVVFDDKGRVKSYSGNPILMDDSVKSDPTIDAILREQLPVVTQYKQKILGRSLVDFPKLEYNCKVEECGFGNLVTDAFRDYATRIHFEKYNDDQQWTSAPIAIYNGGGFRRGLSRKDPISRYSMIRTMPFSDTLYIVEIYGKTLLEALENSVARIEVPGGQFLQMSGMWVIYDLDKPVGQRVVSVETLCLKCSIPTRQYLSTWKRYKLVMVKWHVRGNDGYKMFLDDALSKRMVGAHTDVVDRLTLVPQNKVVCCCKE